MTSPNTLSRASENPAGCRYTCRPMANHKKDKGLQSPEDFERSLKEEISLTTDFELPLSVLVALVDGGWDETLTREALGVLRIADLITATAPEELTIALPNTRSEDARAVERRLREAISEARIGITPYQPGDTVLALVDRARQAAHAAAASGGL